MNTTTLEIRPHIEIVNGQAKTNSLIVAEHFGKRHDRVLDKIRNLDCSPEFNAHNFVAVEYADAKGEKRPAYEMTRDGFTFLAMGFTGKEAAKWKEAYINAFNQMEAALIGQQAQPQPSPALPGAAIPPRQLYLVVLENGQMQAPVPLPMDAFVAEPAKLAGIIGDPFFVPRHFLPAILHAAGERLAGAWGSTKAPHADTTAQAYREGANGPFDPATGRRSGVH